MVCVMVAWPIRWRLMRGHKVDTYNPPVAGSNSTGRVSKSGQFAGEIQCRPINTRQIAGAVYCTRTKNLSNSNSLDSSDQDRVASESLP